MSTERRDAARDVCIERMGLEESKFKTEDEYFERIGIAVCAFNDGWQVSRAAVLVELRTEIDQLIMSRNQVGEKAHIQDVYALIDAKADGKES